MGALTSKPKTPTYPTYTYTEPVVTPISQPPAVNVSTAEATSSTDAETGSNGEQETSVAYGGNDLLHRSRGRLSTVLTGFRGLLTKASESTAPRKSLLGE